MSVKDDISQSERVAATGLCQLLCSVLDFCFLTVDVRITSASLIEPASVLCRDDCSFVSKRIVRNSGVVSHVYRHHIPSWLRKG